MSGLTADQKSQYDDKGYVLLEAIFQPQELKGLIDEINNSVDQIAKSYYANESIRSKYEDHGFDTRLMKIIGDAPDAYDALVGSVAIFAVVTSLAVMSSVLIVVLAISNS